MSKPEEIFNNNANKIMIEWDIDDFKWSHPMLFNVIIKSIVDYKNEPTL